MEQSKMYEKATEWAFDTNGDKWSNNNNEAADNHRSFIAGWRAAESEYDITTLRARCDRYEKVLGLIKSEAGNPDKCIDDHATITLWNIINFCNEALSGEGKEVENG